MNGKLIQDFKNAWKNANAATIGFAVNIPPSQWEVKPFNPRFKSFAWEFACLSRTRMCYLKGLKTGQLTFSHQGDIPDKEVFERMTKREILDNLRRLSRDILKEIEKVKSENAGMVVWLLQHERVHQGKLILYLSEANFKLPKSFIMTWGESNFPK